MNCVCYATQRNGTSTCAYEHTFYLLSYARAQSASASSSTRHDRLGSFRLFPSPPFPLLPIPLLPLLRPLPSPRTHVLLTPHLPPRTVHLRHPSHPSHRTPERQNTNTQPSDSKLASQTTFKRPRPFSHIVRSVNPPTRVRSHLPNTLTPVHITIALAGKVTNCYLIVVQFTSAVRPSPSPSS